MSALRVLLGHIAPPRVLLPSLTVVPLGPTRLHRRVFVPHVLLAFMQRHRHLQVVQNALLVLIVLLRDLQLSLGHAPWGSTQLLQRLSVRRVPSALSHQRVA